MHSLRHVAVPNYALKSVLSLSLAAPFWEASPSGGLNTGDSTQVCISFFVGWRYFSSVVSIDCIISPFTGDNSATVVALSAPGDALLSLGTSTTLLLSIP